MKKYKKQIYPCPSNSSSDRPSLVTLCPSAAAISYAYQQSSCNCKSAARDMRYPFPPAQSAVAPAAQLQDSSHLTPSGCGAA